MKYTVKTNQGEAVFSFTVNAQEWEEAIEKAYQKTKHQYSQQGFRKGHVPRKVLEGIYGVGLFFEDAFNEMFPQWYGEALKKETELIPVADPKVEIQSIDAKGVKFKATVVLKPEVELGQYKDFTLKKTKVSVSAKDVENELKVRQDKASRMVEVDRPVENGDEINLDYSGSVDGKLFDGGTAQKQTLVIGSHTFIPGFEEQLIGVKKGETKSVEVTFPEDYHSEELKGKQATFVCTVNEIRVKELPELNDDFAKDVSEFDTLDELKKDIKKELKEAAVKRAEVTDENNLIEKVVENSKVNVPVEMVETQIDAYVQEFEYTLMYQGIRMEDYFKYTESKMEQLRENYRERAQQTVKTRLVMEAIIKAEHIEPKKEEVDAKIAEIAKQQNQETEAFTKTLNPSQMDYIVNMVVSESLVAYLKSVNRFE